MEEGQRRAVGNGNKFIRKNVLILVVMEEGQRLVLAQVVGTLRQSLNPCCNGRGSKT